MAYARSPILPWSVVLAALIAGILHVFSAFFCECKDPVFDGDWTWHFLALNIGRCFVCAGAWRVLLDPHGRYDAARLTHRWTQRYIFIVTCLTSLNYVWTVTGCCAGQLAIASVLYAVKSCAWVAQELTTIYLTVRRLNLVAMPRARYVAQVLWLALVVSGVAFFLVGLLAVLGLAEQAWVISPMISGTLCYTALHVVVCFALGAAAREAGKEVVNLGVQGSSDCNGTFTSPHVHGIHRRVSINVARFAWYSLFALLTSVATTLLKTFVFMFTWPDVNNDPWCHTTLFVDFCTTMGMVLIFAGLVGPVHVEDRLLMIGRLVEQARERRIRDKLSSVMQATEGPAVTLAAMFENADPDEMLVQARSRFRCISWVVLASRPEIITGGGSLDGTKASEDLFELSEPCNLSECDVFLSHSWHDNGKLKFGAIEAWCKAFEREHSRPPKLWLDKVCINQNDIKKDLQCLPIFLAGCGELLVVSGRTYTSRLWCVVELFVHHAMCSDDGCCRPPCIMLIGHTGAEQHTIADAWRNFDAATCSCVDPADKSRMFAVIHTYQGGVREFNEHIKAIASTFAWSSAGIGSTELADNLTELNVSLATKVRLVRL